MKKNTMILGVPALVLALALPAHAAAPIELAVKDTGLNGTATAATAGSEIVELVSKQVADKPSEAGNIVKQAIIQVKASDALVLQIVKAAVIEAPDQAEAIRKVAITLAPDAEAEIEIVIASVLQGDQVAAENSKNAGHEPEGKEPIKNTVWLTNYGALTEGSDGTIVNTLSSKVQNTAKSPNANHNAGATVSGGSTVILLPTTSTAP